MTILKKLILFIKLLFFIYQNKTKKLKKLIILLEILFELFLLIKNF